MPFNLSQLISRKQGFVPDGVYSVLIHAAEKQTSKTGNPMIVLDAEVVAPETVAHVNNRNEVTTYATAHSKFRAWWSFAVNDYLKANIEKCVTFGVTLREDYATPAELINDVIDQLVEILPQHVFEAALTTRSQFATRPLTQAEADEGKETGEIILDPATRQPKVLRSNIQMNLEGIIGGPYESNAAF